MLDLKHLQEYAHYLSTTRGWDKECIRTRLHYLKSEILEATREIEAIHKVTSLEDRKKHIDNLGLELFDIIWNVAEIANRYGIDLTLSSERKMLINQKRDFSEKPKEVKLISEEEEEITCTNFD